MQKNLIASALAVVLVALGATTGSAGAQSGGPFVIGMIAATTGAAASIGARQLNVMKWWADETNKAGGIKGRKIELVACNDEGNPEKAVACARDLLAKKPVGISISALTAGTRAVLPLLSEGPIATLPGPNVIPGPETYAFQTTVIPDDLHSAIADMLIANGVKKFGFIAATDASGEVNVESANRIFPPRGLQMVLQRIDLRATDASAQIARMAGEDIPLIYSTYSGRGAATVVKSYFNLGLEKPMMINFANTSEAFIAEIKDVLPKRLLGITFRAAVPELVRDPADRARALAFKAAYEKFSGENVDEFSILGKLQGDVFAAILQNMDNPYDFRAVKHYLETNPVPSVQTLRWSAQSHTAMGPSDITLVEYKDGAWRVAAPLKK